MKKLVLTAVLTAFSVNAQFIPLNADDDNAQYILNPSSYNINPRTQLNVALPSSFDLRDVDGMNFITPPQRQNPWGTCWAFGAISAAEGSAQYELWDQYGITPNDLLLDFSELQIAYFSYTAIQESETNYPSQKGEGNYVIDNKNILTKGNLRDVPISLFASGIGPFDEEEIPYTSKSGNVQWVKIDENGNFEYNDEGRLITQNHPMDWEAPDGFVPFKALGDGEDWTVDLKKRFNSKLRLEHAYHLPNPATYDGEGHYVFNQTYFEIGLHAIKQEINLGRPVNIAFKADVSNPEDLKKPTKYISKNYAHYTYEDQILNHSVTIVGYDDDYPVSNFLQGMVNGTDISPPGDGAFICKNSWGSRDDQFYAKPEWGYNGTGYFYLSYYDKSIHDPTSFDFSVVELTSHEEEVIRAIDQHDLLPPKEGWHSYKYDREVAMSNVFTPGRDELLESISTFVFVPNTVVEYEVYKLNDHYVNPTDGTLAASGSQNIGYAGFHLFPLEIPVQIASTESYSIVIRQKDNDGNYYYGLTRSFSKEYVDTYNSLV
eukprot:jgi/Orpsp1_1/1176790/evm.model.c7180000059018.1